MNLSRPQQLVYEMDRFGGGGIATITTSILFERMIDTSTCENAIHRLYEINDSLRIQLERRDSEVYQKVLPDVTPAIKHLQFLSYESFEQYADQYAKEPMDLFERLSEFTVVQIENRTGFLVKVHHLIADAWSLQVMKRQLVRIIDEKTPVSYNYVEYLASEQQYLKSRRYSKSRAFWLEQYGRCDEPTLISDKVSSDLTTARNVLAISRKQSDQIRSYCERNGISVYSFFLTLFSVYFSKIKNNVEKFYLGTAVMNRSGEFEKNTFGMFVNTAPLLVELDYQKSFTENAQQIETENLNVFRHQRFHYGEILRALREEYNFQGRLYDTVLSFHLGDEDEEDSKVAWHHCGMQNESLQIHIRSEKGAFQFFFDYRKDVFSDDDIRAMQSHLLELANNALNSGNKICDLDILSREEVEKIIDGFNDTQVPFSNKCVHQLFEEQVEKTPDNIALKFEEKSFTYAEVQKMAEKIARCLRIEGIGRGDIVAILSKRSYHMVIAMLGIMKAGGAYLHLDTNYPEQRIQDILSDAHVEVVLTYEASCARVKNLDMEKILSTATDESVLENVNDPDDMAAVIYTSGSTGKPKGCMLQHKGLVNFVESQAEKILMNENVISLAIHTFDGFFYETLVPVILGVTCVLANGDEQFNQEKFESLIFKNEHCGIFMVPSRFKQLQQNRKRNWLSENIRTAVIAGEKFPDEIVDLFHLETAVFNAYGPAECSVWINHMKIDPSKETSIGKPIQNVMIYILDRYKKPVPLGVPGEICIGGVCVGKGYINQPELTAERFVDNPFHGGKMYLTGDMGFWREEGNIIFLGRNDRQVKLRGLRIEPEEIERVMEQIEGVIQAAVEVRVDEKNRQYLCGFYTVRTGDELTSDMIRSEIAKILPRYMVPHILKEIAAMPMTPSGKLDRKNLPDIDYSSLVERVEFVEPRNDLEFYLIEEYEDILGVSPISTQEDLFAIGLDSLKAIDFVARAHENGIRVQLQNVFDYPSVKELANFIENRGRKPAEYQKEDFSVIQSYLDEQDFSAHSVGDRILDLGDTLITGATGYLGAHILYRYLQEYPGDAYCIVRGSDEADSQARLYNVLEHYFGGDISSAFSSRIHVLCADLQKDNFGLGEDEYRDLLGKVETVIHTAATVKHYGSYDYFHEINVESVEKLISFCIESGSRLLHISTLSVSGITLLDREKAPRVFHEKNLFIGQSLDNVYIRSKFEAEKRILEAMAAGSLSGQIFRMGNLTNRYCDGRFQMNYESNAFLNRIRSLLALSCVPSELEHFPVEFTPVDLAAEAVLRLARADIPAQVFHVQNTHLLPLSSLAHLFQASGKEMEIVSSDVFYAEFAEAMKDPKRQFIYESFINEIGEDGKICLEIDIEPSSEQTVNILSHIGFEWPKVDLAYIQRYLEEIDRY
ncbi:MAG TPA: amino acid adenylation domain-containing protein [Clostridiaceae bacterium]|nr:amino acid adenylation domain-containing protein [Clostridiaceae bacterium]